MAKKPAIHTLPDGQGGRINRTEGAERGFGRAARKADAEAIGGRVGQAPQNGAHQPPQGRDNRRAP